MPLTTILISAALVLLITNIILTLRTAKKSSDGNDATELKTNLGLLARQLRDTERNLKDEFATNRKETAQGAKDLRDEVGMRLDAFTKTFSAQLGQLTKSNEEKLEAIRKIFDEKLTAFQNSIEINNKENRKELKESIEGIRNTVEKKIAELQKGNEQKLDEMRKTVDEKLNETLEKRLGESFKLVSERLEAVHKGLGDMQNLAKDVGNLNKTMSNVKSRGILGEYQLHNLLEDLLTNDQYAQNVKTKQGSGAVVEFAVKMPNGNNVEKTLWLPIDSKFPKEDYESLVDAYDNGDTDKIEEYRKSFAHSIRKNAMDIKEKYIDPPNTTEYGVMFLPYESLYAEVLRTPGLFEQIQKDYKITIAGPTTLSAFLNSLQMGFRTLAIEKRSSEVWDLLGAVKTEFGKFGGIIEKTRDKLIQATKELDNTGVRSRAIERKLRTVQELPTTESDKLLGDISVDNE
ncbi:DNA recombination protein RmuC [bacterium]|nr:DNA recombination protein RmuC [bacterium]